MAAERRQIRRGDVYMVDLDPVVGHEQGGRRPFLIVSLDRMNRAPAELVIGLPLTTTDFGSELHVRLDPPEGGLSRVSFAMPEMTRSISSKRLRRRLGGASPDNLETAVQRVGILVGLGRSR